MHKPNDYEQAASEMWDAALGATSTAANHPRKFVYIAETLTGRKYSGNCKAANLGVATQKISSLLRDLGEGDILRSVREV
jgi:hypothetical protein